ncbi:MAG: carboxypeptidase regulatory-like domain-containing protein [Bacteroidetes bacterium]|nr:carboxypeptidase regulatory-like domain-containing protein [Bacteroidota bacterium]
MKVRYGTFLLLSMLMALSLWSCKQNVLSVGNPLSARIAGTVFNSNTASPVAGASVILTVGNTKDSVITGSDGTFQFIIDVTDSVKGANITLTVNGIGYLTKTITANVRSDQSFQVALNVDPSAYAIVTGTVRDSASAYPLGGASVLISLPGGSSTTMKYMSHLKARVYSVSSFIVDSTTTLANGSFTMDINLFDLDSISATMIISKAGFKTYQTVRTFKRGANNFGNIPLQIDNSTSVAHLAGRVTDSQSGLPITNVSVVLSSSLKTDSMKTLSDGSYSFDLNLQGLSSTSGTLSFRLNSYRDTTVQFSVNAGQTFAKDVALTAQTTVVGGDSSTGRGIARSFALISVSPSEISIHGVGGTESSTLTWQVRDSLGFPIDINHQDTVFFEISGIPTQGGAYITPSSALTDGSGKILTTVNSGTVAGTIQVIAWLRREPSGEIIQSSPVLIVVDGGLPDQAHFSLGVTQHNFAGYDWIGRTDGVLVQAGDKYGNPVHPGTAIYFTSTWGGISTAPGYTNSIGQATATVFSGNPLPKLAGLDPSLYGDGTGYGWVKASTQGENSVIVSDSTLVLFSATTAPILLNDSTLISPVSIPANGQTTINVHISDRFGNPLEPGTTITTNTVVTPPPSLTGVSVSVNTSGLPSTLDDYLTRGTGITDFTLTVSGSVQGGMLVAKCPFSVTVIVSGRNGIRQASFTGWILP